MYNIELLVKLSAIAIMVFIILPILAAEIYRCINYAIAS